MARPRSVSDDTIYLAVLDLMRQGTGKAVTFSAVAERVNLAASSLAERFGSITGLIAAARQSSWQVLEAQTEAALALAPISPKGVVVLLKELGQFGMADVAIDPARADRWRQRIEAEIALRLGEGAKGREAAAILFAAWQGQVQWRGAGVKSLRLKDLLRRLGY